MRLQWTGLRRPPVPSDVAAAIDRDAGDKLLTWASDGQGTTVVAGRHRLHVVSPTADGGLEHTLDRPWHLVDSGTWSGEDFALRVTWVDRHLPTRFVLPWLWEAGSTGGKALTPEGEEFGYELRFSRYKTLQVKP